MTNAVPVWAVGQVLSAADVNSWFVPMAAIKPGDTGRTNNTSITNDPDLQLTVAANATYLIHGVLEYKGGTQGSSDIKIQVNAPASSTGFITSLRITTAGNTSTDNTAIGSSISAGTNTTANIEPFTLWGSVTTVASGTVAIAWAQNTSSGTTTTVMASSLLVAQRIG